MTKKQQLDILSELAYMQRKLEEAKEPRDLHYYMGQVAALKSVINGQQGRKTCPAERKCDMKKTVSISYLISQMEIDERDTLEKLSSFDSSSSQWHYYHGQLVYIRRQLDLLRSEA